ncbi:DNA ligase [Mycobacterium xenopi]|nr:DNA ligase [Mycobacterium xenopi]SPX94890.1 DNA polymerase LigD-like ligase domain-containing protein [Mycobacterium xenopi]
MLATLGPPPAGDAHAVEWKFDGQRATVCIDDTVAVFSRNGADVTQPFPELAGIAAAIGNRKAVLDGEIVAVDETGRASFTRLHRRWPQQRRPTPQLLREVPVRLLAFDLLVLDGRDVTDYPYAQRRELLDDLMVLEKSPVLTIPRALVGVSAADVLEVAGTQAMEGIVAKRLDSPYRPDRTTLWIKSPVRAVCELIIVGYVCAGGPGGRTSIGSLLLARHSRAGDLIAIGHVGTGFSACTRQRLYTMLQPIKRSTPPVANRVEIRGVQWVEPRRVCEIAYREYVAGRWLRHTSYKGLREVDPTEVRLPTSADLQPAGDLNASVSRPA